MVAIATPSNVTRRAHARPPGSALRGQPPRSRYRPASGTADAAERYSTHPRRMCPDHELERAPACYQVNSISS
jgi:hypothetical protein